MHVCVCVGINTCVSACSCICVCVRVKAFTSSTSGSYFPAGWRLCLPCLWDFACSRKPLHQDLAPASPVAFGVGQKQWKGSYVLFYSVGGRCMDANVGRDPSRHGQGHGDSHRAPWMHASRPRTLFLPCSHSLSLAPLGWNPGQEGQSPGSCLARPEAPVPAVPVLPAQSSWG